MNAIHARSQLRYWPTRAPRVREASFNCKSRTSDGQRCARLRALIGR